MRILFIILTCEKYLETRCKWQKKTWINDIKEISDYLFLSSKSNIESKIYGYNTPDTYETAPIKYVEFFKNYTLRDYDYLYFCDDDTYIDVERLERKITELKDFECYGRIGKVDYNPIIIDNGGKYFPITYPSGGAGFLITRNTFNKIKYYLQTQPYPIFLNTDVTIGSWFQDININIIEGCDLLKSQNPDHPENNNIKDFISFHYCDENHFNDLYKNKNKNVNNNTVAQ